MRHTEFEELLSAYANSELPRTQREFVEEHLSGCADCRASLADHVWVRSRLTSLQSVPTGADITEATMSRIREADTRRWFANRLVRPALIAAAPGCCNCGPGRIAAIRWWRADGQGLLCVCRAPILSHGRVNDRHCGSDHFANLL